MGVRSWLRGDDLLEDTTAPQEGERRSLPRPDNELPLSGFPTIWSGPGGAGGGPGGTSLRAVDAMQVADVWACVRVLSDAVSSLPLHVYRKVDTGRERVTSGKLVDLLERPSPGVTEADLTSTLMCHLAIWGSGYIGKFREAGEVTQLSLIHPDRIRPELEDGRLRFRYTPSVGGQVLLSERDVVWVKGLSVDSLHGLSAVGQAARVLGLSDSLVRHALSFFESKSVRPAGVLRFGSPDTNYSNEARDRFTEDLSNVMKPHGILVVDGDMKYENVAHKLDESQFTEQRRLACQEVCRVFRIPSHFLNAGTGGDSLTYSTSESMSIDFVKYTLTPWLRRIELAISNDVDLAFQRQYVRFETDGLLRADAKTRSEVYTRALDPVTGWMDRNEVRRLEDLPPEDEEERPRAPMVAPPAVAIPTNGGTTNE